MIAAQEPKITKLLSKYKNLSATKKEVMDVLTHYRSLNYKLQKFVFNDGSSKDLFKLEGTIPVVYKNNTYHIPVCLWLMDTYPLHAPMCFVTPTSTMQIKVSMYVDHTGKIYLPFLHDWRPHFSDLLSLIQVMIVTFGEHPPVYSKPKEVIPPYPSSSMMPQPTNSASGSSFVPYPTGGGSGVFPPYPPAGNFSSYPSFPDAISGNNVASGTIHPTSSVYPPYSQPQPGADYNSGYGYGSGTITEEHIKASLISAIQDKLRRRIQEKVNQYQAEIETLNRTKQELMEGSTKINTIIERLQREEDEFKKTIRILQEKESELKKNLELLHNADGIQPDDAVTTTAPLYKQLLASYAEEAGTEDAIYYLGEALRGGVVDLESFLKHVRQLSRKQFMLRATMQKCRQKAGLSG